MTPQTGLEDLGAVVIGRNEGKQLERALQACLPAAAVVYVDSDSSDGSPEMVRQRCPGVRLVELSPDEPLGPALGRNRGFEVLTQEHPNLRYVMFVDGDCELVPGWLQAGRSFLETHPEYGIVTGRLRERQRDRNAYHRLADMEWDQPPGDIEASGGIMMARVQTWMDAGGQNPAMPAGEEKEFFRRALSAGWKARRLDHDMALHDIDMERFEQWWTRAVRTGHSWMQGAWIHRDPENLRHLASIGLYGVALPGFAFGGALPSLGLSLTSLLAYRRLYRRVRADRIALGDSAEDARLYAAATVAGKIAGAVGAAKFLLRTLPRGQSGKR